MIMKRALTILSVSILAAAWLCGCGKIRKTESRDADVLYHACYSEPYVTLDPSAEQSNGIRILYNVYETLTHYDDKTGEVIPKLAVEWSSNADATEWVFKLRNDVQFHDGEKMNAEAVKKSIDRTIALNKGAAYIWDSVDSIEVTGEYEVTFHLRYGASIGCPMFAVTFMEEAVKLREAGIKAPILVMMPAESKELLIAGKHKLIITITDYEMAKQISDELVKQSYSLPAHLKVDCGLSRMGIVLKDRLEEAAEEAAKIHALPNLNTEAVFSHLTAAGTEGAYAALDLAEQQRFFELIKMLKKKNISIKTHLMSSDPYIWYPQTPGDYIRVGSILYGICPERYSCCGIKNCMSMNTYIVQIKWIPRDTEVSYGPLYRTVRRTKIAVVPVGFADGIRRALSNKGEMLIHGKRVPIIGKICCDHTILDVTDIEEVKVGDEVTIFGRNGEESQTAGDYAELCNASAPETTVIFSARIPRNYLNM